MRNLWIITILLIGCYVPADLDATDEELAERDAFLDELEQCEPHVVGSCLLIEDSFRTDFACQVEAQPQPPDETNPSWCAWDACRDTLGWPLYESTIAEGCYQLGCPGAWRARAAYQKCERDLSDQEFEDDYVGCLLDLGCESPSACDLHQTEDSLAIFKERTIECAVELRQRIRG